MLRHWSDYHFKLFLKKYFRGFITFSITIILICVGGGKAVAQEPSVKSPDIEIFDSALLDHTLAEVIATMKLDTSEYIPMLMFAREVHGIYVRLATSKFTVIVDKPYIMSDEQLKAIEIDGWLNSSWKSIAKYIASRKVVGICWSKWYPLRRKIVGDMKYHNCWDY